MLLYKKKMAFREAIILQLHKLQKEIKCEIRAGKRKYKDKIETQLRMNNVGSAWDSMKTIVGLEVGYRSNIELKG